MNSQKIQGIGMTSQRTRERMVQRLRGRAEQGALRLGRAGRRNLLECHVLE